MSLFTYSGKTLFESKIDYLFLVGASFTALPFIIQIKQNSIVLIGGAILLLLSGVIIARIFRNQSK